MKGVGSKRGPISKKSMDFPLFQSKTKIYDPGKVKFKNDPKRVCLTAHLSSTHCGGFTLSLMVECQAVKTNFYNR